MDDKNTKQTMTEFFSSSTEESLTAFPALSKFMDFSADKKNDEDKASDSAKSSEETLRSSNGKRGGGNNSVLNEQIVDSLDSIGDRLKVQSIVLASSLEQQTRTNQILNRLGGSGNAVGGSGGGIASSGSKHALTDSLLDGVERFLGTTVGKGLLMGGTAAVLLAEAPHTDKEIEDKINQSKSTEDQWKKNIPSLSEIESGIGGAAKAVGGWFTKDGTGADTNKPDNDAKVKYLQDMIARIEQHLKLNIESEAEKARLLAEQVDIQKKINELQKDQQQQQQAIVLDKTPTQVGIPSQGSPNVRIGTDHATHTMLGEGQTPLDIIHGGGSGNNGQPAQTAGGDRQGGAHTAGRGGSRSTGGGKGGGGGLNQGDNNLVNGVDAKEATDAGFTAKQWDAYRLGVTDLESKGKGYDIAGGAGGHYLGKYQIGHAEIAGAAKRLGVDTPTDDQFRKDPKMQEKFFENYTMDHYNTMMKDPEFAKLSKEDQLKYLGVGHNQGVGNSIQDIGSAHIVGALATLHGRGWGHDAWGTKSDRYYNSVGARLQSTDISPMGKSSPGSEVGKGVGLNANNDADDAKIEGYMKDAGVPINARNFAWCAAWVNAQLRHEGVVGSGSQLANSFAAWGRGETGEQAKRGDVMELKDGSHVGRFTGKSRMGKNGMEYEMYSGNAGNADHAHGQFGSVSESYYSGDKINFRGMPEANAKKDDNGLIPLAPEVHATRYRPEDSKDAAGDVLNQYARDFDDYSDKDREFNRGNAFKHNDTAPTVAGQLVKKSHEDAVKQAAESKHNATIIQQFASTGGAHTLTPVGKSDRLSDKKVGDPNAPSPRLKELFTDVDKKWY
jgi:hypothetical protein